MKELIPALESLRNQPASARPVPVTAQPLSVAGVPVTPIPSGVEDLESIMLPGVESDSRKRSQVEFQSAFGRICGRAAVGRCRSWHMDDVGT